MKTTKYLTFGISSLVIIAMLMFVSCDNTQRELDAEVNEFDSWVEETGNDFEQGAEEGWQETEQAWNETQREYNEMVNNLEGKTAEMKEETRENYMQAKRDFEQMQSEMEHEVTRRKGMAEIETVMMVEDPDEGLTNVTEENIVDVYRQFVNTVDNYKQQWTAQQWNVLEQYWDMLNNRKNEVEDQISGEENGEIAELKLKYAGLKTIHKTGAKLESKDNQ